MVHHNYSYLHFGSLQLLYFELQQTANYKIRGRRCARRIGHRDYSSLHFGSLQLLYVVKIKLIEILKLELLTFSEQLFVNTLEMYSYPSIGKLYMLGSRMFYCLHVGNYHC